jgi:hypothetical protein
VQVYSNFPLRATTKYIFWTIWFFDFFRLSFNWTQSHKLFLK